MRRSGRPKNSTGLVEVRRQRKEQLLAPLLIPGASPRTIVIWETK